MRRTIRNAAAAFVFIVALCAPATWAREPGGTQVELTQSTIDALIEAQPDMRAATLEGGASAADLLTRFDTAAKKHGFASGDEYSSVHYSVLVVLIGIDPETKAFVGAEAASGKEIAAIEAAKSISPARKTALTQSLREAAGEFAGVKPSAGNLALVTANYRKLVMALRPSARR